MKRPVLCMKVSVHLASIGSPEKAAATIAAAGAAKSRVKPRKARKMSKAEGDQDAEQFTM